MVKRVPHLEALTEECDIKLISEYKPFHSWEGATVNSLDKGNFDMLKPSMYLELYLEWCFVLKGI